MNNEINHHPLSEFSRDELERALTILISIVGYDDKSYSSPTVYVLSDAWMLYDREDVTLISRIKRKMKGKSSGR